MIDLASNLAIAGVVTLLVAMEAFFASHKFVQWWCMLVTIILWSRNVLVELVIDLRGHTVSVVSSSIAYSFDLDWVLDFCDDQFFDVEDLV